MIAFYICIFFIALFTLRLLVEIVKEKRCERWLNEHFVSLTFEAQERLMELRDDYKSFKHTAQRVRYDPDYYSTDWWRTIRAEILAERRYRCEACGAKANHIHHRHYGSVGNEDPNDLVALCPMCHYFIHPKASMARKAFEEHKKP